MEIMACIAGLEALQRASKISLYSDSRYVVNSVRLGWARRWRQNGWMRAPDAGGASQPAENIDLWERMLGLLDRHDVTFYWVRGHASHPENERCDRLAVAAAHAKNLPEDQGFSSKECKG
jgi:ribonuclease HI